MRKATEKKDNKAEELNQLIHEMYDVINEEMDKKELKGFVTRDNQPKMRELETDDRIGVDEVLIIGNYMALNKLHNELHRKDGFDAETLKKELDKVFEGKLELKMVMPEDMPDEIVESLESIVEMVRKKKKGGKK